LYAYLSHKHWSKFKRILPIE